MTRQQVLDLYFLDARFKLIELAAFLDRVDRAEGQTDFRLDAFRRALRELAAGGVVVVHLAQGPAGGIAAEISLTFGAVHPVEERRQFDELETGVHEVE